MKNHQIIYKFKSVFLVVIVGILFFLIWQQTQEIVLSGTTMGTYYRVTYDNAFFQHHSLKEKIDQCLSEVNQQFSTYDSSSALSVWNASSNTEFVPVSPAFYEVCYVAKWLHHFSDGAWDGTLKPIIELWGFGAGTNTKKVPDPTLIQAQLAGVGMDKVLLKPDVHYEINTLSEQLDTIRGSTEDLYIRKTHPNIALDFSSVAKGYAVDRIAALLKAQGIDEFLVDIGGEIFASERPNQKTWQVGINTPEKDAAYQDVYRVVALSGKAIATSGDYRNFFKEAGQDYHHILDPQTGFPVRNGVVSVSVLADQCMVADGLATAFMVMGVEKGMALAKQIHGVDVFFIRSQNDELEVDLTDGFFRVSKE